MSDEWIGLGPAVNDTIDKLISAGLPSSARRDAFDLIWKLAAWHGDREYRNGQQRAADDKYRAHKIEFAAG